MTRRLMMNLTLIIIYEKKIYRRFNWIFVDLGPISEIIISILYNDQISFWRETDLLSAFGLSKVKLLRNGSSRKLREIYN